MKLLRKKVTIWDIHGKNMLHDVIFRREDFESDIAFNVAVMNYASEVVDHGFKSIDSSHTVKIFSERLVGCAGIEIFFEEEQDETNA